MGSIREIRRASSGRFSVSAVSVAVPSPTDTGPGADRLVVPLLRRARALGVTGFDLSRCAPAGPAARWLHEAIGANDADLVVFVGGGTGPSTSAAASGRVGEGSPPAEWKIVRDRLGARTRLVEVLPTESSSADRQEAERLRAQGELVDVARALDASDEAVAVSDSGLRWSEFSLLRTEAARAMRGSMTPHPGSVLAFDVFAGGALDGSRVEQGPLARGPVGRPPSVTELDRLLAPVLHLGYLSRPGRPLHRAALDFVLGWPWVLTAVVPLPTPERIERVLESPAGPPLTPDELARLGLGPPRSDTG